MLTDEKKQAIKATRQGGDSVLEIVNKFRVSAHTVLKLAPLTQERSQRRQRAGLKGAAIGRNDDDAPQMRVEDLPPQPEWCNRRKRSFKAVPIRVVKRSLPRPAEELRWIDREDIERRRDEFYQMDLERYEEELQLYLNAIDIPLPGPKNRQQ